MEFLVGNIGTPWRWWCSGGWCSRPFFDLSLLQIYAIKKPSPNFRPKKILQKHENGVWFSMGYNGGSKKNLTEQKFTHWHLEFWSAKCRIQDSLILHCVMASTVRCVAIFLSENDPIDTSLLKRSPRSLALPRDDAVRAWDGVHIIGDCHVALLLAMTARGKIIANRES